MDPEMPVMELPTMARHANQTSFKKGHKMSRGRPKGSKNKFTRDLKEAIVAAAENLGMNNLGYAV